MYVYAVRSPTRSGPACTRNYLFNSFYYVTTAISIKHFVGHLHTLLGYLVVSICLIIMSRSIHCGQYWELFPLENIYAT